MSFNSDIINTLSYKLPLNAGISHTTEKIIAGQYSSITLSFASDQDTTVLVQFSPDGTNWDISNSKNFSAGITGSENLVILSKWMQIIITNTSGVNQTYLRIYVYGSVMNTSLNAIISKIAGKSPGVAIDNFPLGAFNDLRVANIDTKYAYSFTIGNTSTVNSNTIQCYYPDLRSETNASVVQTVDFVDRMINLKMNGALGDYASIIGKTIRYVSGISGTYRFTMKFSYSDSDKGSWLLVGTGFKLIDFYGFGWYLTPNVPNTYDNFAINYFIDSTHVAIPRTAWNGDKADGTGDLGVLDLTKINVCQIQHTYLGSGPVKFFIMNSSSDWVLVHTLTFQNTRTATTSREPSFGFSMYGYIPPGSTIGSGTDTVSCGSFSIQHDGYIPEIVERHSVEHSTVSKAITGGTETHIYTLQNYGFYQGIEAHAPITIDEISLACDGTKNTVIRCYLNTTLGGTPAYAYIDNYSSLRKDEAGTLSVNGRLIESIFLPKAGQQELELDGKNIVLSSTDTFTITALSSANSDVFVSVNYHVH